jgi:hypothetical protein
MNQTEAMDVDQGNSADIPSDSSSSELTENLNLSKRENPELQVLTEQTSGIENQDDDCANTNGAYTQHRHDTDMVSDHDEEQAHVRPFSWLSCCCTYLNIARYNLLSI